MTVSGVDFDNVALTTEDFVEQSDAWMRELDKLIDRREDLEALREMDGHVNVNTLVDYTYLAVNCALAGLALLVGRANGKALRSRG